MYPTIPFLGLELGSYGILALFGLLVSGTFACLTAGKRGFSGRDMLELLTVSGLGLFAGAHLLYAITLWPDLVKVLTHLNRISSWEQAGELFRYLFGGAVFYGGLLGGMAVGILWAKRKKLSVPDFSDIAAPAVPLFHAFGRIGCFLGGCCYGKECSFGFVYSHSLIREANGVSRFPVQLLEAGFNVFLFFLLWALLRKGVLKGRLFSLYLTLYAAGRFALEFLRGDPARGFMLGLSTSQWISLFLFVLAGLYLLFARPKAPDRPPAAEPDTGESPTEKKQAAANTDIGCGADLM